MKTPIAPTLIAALLLVACQGGTEPSSAPEATTGSAAPEATVTYEGIDVSHYQGTVDWQAVRAAGITFAFAKATGGRDDVDPEFAANWQGMKDAGIARGAYHFFYPKIDAVAQAEHFIDTVTLEPGDLPPMIDIEKSEAMDSETIDQDVARWLEIVARHYGVRPILYSDKRFIETYLASGFEQHPLWLAEYENESPDPSTWSPWSHWTLWQYTQSGTVDGVTGEVDRDRYQGSEQGWQTLLLPTEPTTDEVVEETEHQ